jgi:hypothetical protein
MMPVMSEDETPIDPEQIPDALKAFKKQLDALREEFDLLVHYSYDARGQIKLVADGGGIRTDPALVERCHKFAAKYHL